jgi:hypothetical protein
VPYTQDYCAAGGSCQVSGPTFWSTVRLASITTQQWNGTAYAPADSWSLARSLPQPADQTSPTLWLDSVTHTGSDTTAGGSTVKLSKVSFTPVDQPNRVNPGIYNRLLVPLTAANQPQAPPELRAALAAITRHIDDYANHARLPRTA